MESAIIQSRGTFALTISARDQRAAGLVVSGSVVLCAHDKKDNGDGRAYLGLSRKEVVGDNRRYKGASEGSRVREHGLPPWPRAFPKAERAEDREEKQ